MIKYYPPITNGTITKGIDTITKYRITMSPEIALGQDTESNQN